MAEEAKPFDDALAAAEAIQGKPDVTPGVEQATLAPSKTEALVEPEAYVEDPRDRRAARLVGSATVDTLEQVTGEKPSHVVKEAASELASLLLEGAQRVGQGLWVRGALIGGTFLVILAPMALAAMGKLNEDEPEADNVPA